MIQWVTSDEDVSHPAGCPHLTAEPLQSTKMPEPKRSQSIRQAITRSDRLSLVVHYRLPFNLRSLLLS
jgi:hypothetical protein